VIDRDGKRRFTHKGYSESIVNEYRHELELLLPGH
jgi:hypothetical protein